MMTVVLVFVKYVNLLEPYNSFCTRPYFGEKTNPLKMFIFHFLNELFEIAEELRYLPVYTKRENVCTVTTKNSDVFCLHLGVKMSTLLLNYIKSL